MNATRHMELVDGKLLVHYHLANPVQYTANESGVSVERRTYRIRIQHIKGRNARYQIFACDEKGESISRIPIRDGMATGGGDDAVLKKEFNASVTAHVNSYAAFKNLAIRSREKG